MRRVAIVAIRGTTGAKSRLASRFSGPERDNLAWTMLTRVLATLHASQVVDHVLLVTREPEATYCHVSDAIHQTILPQSAGRPGLNPAFDLGREWAIAHDYDALLILHPDLPLLEVPDLHAILRPAASLVIAPDLADRGTNALLLHVGHPRGGQFVFGFGTESHAHHLAEAERLELPVATVRTPGLARDLDGPSDWDKLPATIQARLTHQPVAPC
jgi:2-phospho-L-lactate guanylyltransferase